MAAPFCLRPVRARHRASNISAFKVRKAVRTLARICDVPYHRQPLTPQLRHHMAASVAQLVEHRSRKAGVTGSSPVAGSIAFVQLRSLITSELFLFSRPSSPSLRSENGVKTFLIVFHKKSASSNVHVRTLDNPVIHSPIPSSIKE